MTCASRSKSWPCGWSRKGDEVETVVYGASCREDDLEAMIEADRAFHDALVQASGNSVLLEMLPTLSDRTRLLIELNAPRRSEQMGHEAALRGLQGHQRILKSLRDGNQEAAAQALRHELTSGKEHALERMSKGRVEDSGGD